ncbi:hypothetical protein J4H86_20120 [Spiractinospora alimapuensis]|uniref:hypothetical protein n=1 Tax=Spiractinospora alimapuensis TaxID=2820884 RepID=UPI001F25CC50|nr:hypothetical protein [Spiractinospora alimapuensis]QVQ51116.1 hypothetical protein J4H86_20120 [Spiractinospora alimapuensis]
MSENKDDLERLSSHELHRRAMERARHHVDLAFLWRLFRALPAAEAAAGNVDAARAGVAQMTGLIGDVISVREEQDPALLDALRPIYIDYLAKHS